MAGAASGTSTFRMICRRDAPSVSAVSTYRCGTSSTAAVVSLTTKATLAMNRNITFWNSPMPNRKNVSGMSAATGMLRPKTVSGARNARTAGKQAASTPSGTPTTAVRPKPRQTLASVRTVLATSFRSPNTRGSSRSVSAGLGSMAGLMKRASASPAVAMNQAASTHATQVIPQSNAVAAGASPRRGRAGAATAFVARLVPAADSPSISDSSPAPPDAVIPSPPSRP